ncbi:MAG: hypothetical protein WC807_10505 [Hyphomicrobium sp.]|jgi:hypothetical protein
MARILICHVPKDGATARELGATLMGRGHYVSFDGEPDVARADRTARVRQFEAVIVVWTEYSLASAGLADIARETLPLNILVPIRSESVDAAGLPLIFRKLNMLAPRDVDAIARLVARLSTAASSLKEMAVRDAQRKDAEELERAATPAIGIERRQATPTRTETSPVTHAEAPGGRSQPLRRLDLPEVNPQTPAPDTTQRQVVTGHQSGPSLPNSDYAEPANAEPAQPARVPIYVRPEPPAAPTASAQDLAQLLNAGLLITQIPRAMWHGEPLTIEIQIDKQVLASSTAAVLPHERGPRERGRAALPSAERIVIETLSISLYGLGDAFEIERQSERTQFVSERFAIAEGRDPGSFGRWAWLVTPRTAGDQELVVRVSALLRDRRGVPTPVSLPDRRFPVSVQIPEGVSVASTLAGWLRR